MPQFLQDFQPKMPGQQGEQLSGGSCTLLRDHHQRLDEPDLSNRGEQPQILKYGVISAYTSFVAGDCATRTGGSYGTTVNVPQGTRYETTVGGR